MKMPERGKIEWNLNTILLLLTFFGGVGSTLASVTYFASQLASTDRETKIAIMNLERETKEWQTRHEQLHRERLAQTTADNSRMEQRMTQSEAQVAKMENLTYRITVAEQAGINTGKSIERLTETVNGQSADIRVMREIIERQFGTQFQRRTR